MKPLAAAILSLALVPAAPALAGGGTSLSHRAGASTAPPAPPPFLWRHGDRRRTPVLLWFGYRSGPLRTWDDGFFSDTGGGAVTVVNGEARYRYDRGYPYDHYDLREDAPGGDPDRPPRCRTEWTWSERDREEVPVRICS